MTPVPVTSADFAGGRPTRSTRAACRRTRLAARGRPWWGEGEHGVTLVELMVVVAIIAILAALAIPVFYSQSAKAYDAQAKDDARDIATHEESYRTSHDVYVDSTRNSALPDFQPSGGTQTNVKANGADGFCAVSKSHSGNYFVYDSGAGGLQSQPYDAFPGTTPRNRWPKRGSCAMAAPDPF